MFRMRGLALIIAAVVCVAALLAPVAVAGTVLFAGGTTGSLGRLVPSGIFGGQGSFLGGAYKNDTFTVLDYPSSLWPITGLLDPTLGASVAIGTENLIAAVKTTPGALVVAGTSQGAMVAQQTAVELNGDTAVPSDTTFILIADPNFGLLRGLQGVRIPVLAYTPQPYLETRFNVEIVVNEYDGFADSIAHPWNLLTDLNALMALIYVHPFAQNSDLAMVPPEDVTVTTNGQGGTTTTYFVPTLNLPLTMPLRQLCVPAPIVDAIDAVLRPIIDAGYDREQPYPSSATAQSTAAARAHRGVEPTQRPAVMPATPTVKRAAAERRRLATASARTAGSSSLSAATGTSVRR